MNENAKTDRYKKLLIRRDTLKKESELFWLQYVKEFGVLLEELFQCKLDCIALKKRIAYCQSKINRKERVDLAEVENFVQIELTEYYDTLQTIRSAKDAVSTPISSYDLLQIKKLYRKIASIVHPDLHPELFQKEEIRELWQRAKAAYDANDLPALQDAEFLLLQAIGNEHVPTAIENIDDRIDALQNEIKRILTTRPYQYRYILEDLSLVAEQKQELTEEIDTYRHYKKDLQERFDRLQNDFAQYITTEVYS